MGTITQDMIDKAAENVARTAAELRDVERLFGRGSITVHSHSQLDDARSAAEHAAIRLSSLEADFAEEQTARASREAAGRTAAADMPDTPQRLGTARDAAARAVAAAEAAMTRALAALDAYDQAVVGAAEALRVRGLRSLDGEATGARMDGGLQFDGERWQRVDSPTLLESAFLAVVARQNPAHALGRRRPSFGGIGGASRSDLFPRSADRKQSRA